MEEEIIKKLKELEKRLEFLENKKNQPTEKTTNPSKQLKGISGGIQELIDNNFLNTPKEIGEIVEELKKEGYFATIQSIDSSVRNVFFKSRKALTRIKEKNKWKYVIKK